MVEAPGDLRGASDREQRSTVGVGSMIPDDRKDGCSLFLDPSSLITWKQGARRFESGANEKALHKRPKG